MSALCMVLIGVIVLFELPKWAIVLTMIAPVLLLADVYVTWRKEKNAK